MSASSFFEQIPFKAKLIGWGVLFVPLATLFLFGTIFGGSEPIDQRIVWGCYVADDAPSIDIRENAIYIIEPARRKFNYIAEPSKDSYHINVEPALELKRVSNGRYEFFPTRGIGFFWPLLPDPEKNRVRLRHPSEFAGHIQVSAEEGSVIYSRTSNPDSCRH